ncbi:aromatic amino acid transaminase [Novosphingobium sp. RD2P27]|uniref:Aromatic amino acid transaminase n=1 Tax=Novosphingobium kalidii TaxID=3230299 RepID=A0ABV2D1G0_9SPHN
MSLSDLQPLGLDPILSIAARVARDPRPERVDFGIGVYRDAEGHSPIFAAVKAAEARIARDQRTKAYLSPLGDTRFVAAMSAAAFGEHLAFAGLQTVGGTGALHLAMHVLAATGSGRKVVLGTPTWPNHAPIAASAGLGIRTYAHRADVGGAFDPAPLLQAIATCSAGDVFVLHGCCHNPTGIDPNLAQWQDIAAAIAAAGALPLIDLAYQGFGEGWAEDQAVVALFHDAVPELLVAYSCDKNFGLYRDRVGMLTVKGRDATSGQMIVQHLAAAARTAYSMPPDHGAVVVRTILEDAELSRLWRSELDAMRARLASLRQAFAMALEARGLGQPCLSRGFGMFGMLDVAPGDVEQLTERFAIFLPPSGRINLAALTDATIERLADALLAVRAGEYA